MEICSIGFTRKSAERFFDLLDRAGVEQLIDVRLNNTSQLAGFAKRDDLRYFLDRILGAAYVQEPSLAPTQGMLADYKRNRGRWDTYEERFLRLLQEREVEQRLDRDFFSPKSALLCSEDAPTYCHRRLVLEYLQRHWGDIEISHL